MNQNSKDESERGRRIWLSYGTYVRLNFMRCIFRDNEPLAQLILRIVLRKDDLIVEDVETQADLHGLSGARSIALDVLARDSDKKKYDIEIQRSDQGASKSRARYHSSAMDVDNLKKAYEFESLPESYVIFYHRK